MTILGTDEIERLKRNINDYVMVKTLADLIETIEAWRSQFNALLQEKEKATAALKSIQADIKDLRSIQLADHDGTHAFDDGARFACSFLKDHPDPAVRRIQLDISAGCIAKRRAREAKAGT